MMSSVRFSIVVVFSRSPEELRRLSDSLLQNGFDPSCDELIVISAHLPLDLGLPSHWFQTQEARVGAKKNLGLSLAKGRLVLFLDDDTWLPSAEFFKRLEVLLANPNLVAAGGGFIEETNLGSVSRAYNRLLNIYLQSQKNPRSLLGANFCVRRLQGLAFDERVDFGAIEDCLMQQLHAHGAVLYEAALNVHHDPRMTLLDLIWKAWRQGMNQRKRAITFSQSRKLELFCASRIDEIFLMLAYHAVNKVARFYSAIF